MNHGMMNELVEKMKNEINQEYQKLKSSSKTYGELSKKIDTFRKNIAWDNAGYGDIAGRELSQLLKRDIESLQIEKETGAEAPDIKGITINLPD